MFRFINLFWLFSAVLILPFFIAGCYSEGDLGEPAGTYTITYYDRENHNYTSFLYRVRADGGQSIVLPDLENEEYRWIKGRENDTFYGWKDIYGEMHQAGAYTVTSNMELDAVWELKLYTVTFYDGNGVLLDNRTQHVELGGSVQLPGYIDNTTSIFLGWKRDTPQTKAAENGVVTINGDTKFYMAWVEKLTFGDFHHLRFFDNTTQLPLDGVAGFNPFLPLSDGGGLKVPTLAPTLTLPAPADFKPMPVHPDYDFLGWYVYNTGNPYRAGYTGDITGSGDFYARWRPKDPANAIMVKGNLYDDDVLLATIDEYPVNALNLVTYDIQRRRYTFIGWSPADEPWKLYYSDKYIEVTINKNTDFNARFELDNPTLIGDPQDFDNIIRNDPDGSYQLTNDIDLTSIYPDGSWIPIGSGLSGDNFTGVLDGGGKTVKVCIDFDKLPTANQYYVGLFGVISNGARIDNLTVEIPASCGGIKGTNYVGAVAGFARGDADNTTKIVNTKVIGDGLISVSNTTAGETVYAGGITGRLGDFQAAAAIIHSSNAVEISASGNSAYAGGITGIVTLESGSYLHRTSNSAKITSRANGTSAEGFAGGIAGRYRTGIPLTFSYNTGEVTAYGSNKVSIWAGGITGRGNLSEDCYNAGNISAINTSSASSAIYTYAGGLNGAGGEIARSYNRGSVHASGAGPTDAGGLAGDAEESITNSYNIGAVSAVTTNSYIISGGITGLQFSGIINRTYNLGNLNVSFPKGTVYAAGIIGNMQDVLVLGNAAINTSITATGSTKRVNRILGGIRSGGGYNVGINFALNNMSGSFTNNTGFYPGDSKTAAEFLTKKLYADPIDLGDGLEFEFCEDIQELRRPCGEEYPWKLPSTASDYKYPILYWQNSNNPF